MNGIVSAGFLLVRPVRREAYMPAELLPETIVSASSCISPRFPGGYAIEWCSAAAEGASGLTEACVPATLHADAVAWATAAFGESFGWPEVFYSLAAAREARQRFIDPPESLMLLGLGLPESFVDAFIEEATPPQSPPGYAPNGESGFLECVRRREPLPDGGRLLGFEPLNLFAGMLQDSWLCSGVEVHCASALGIRPAANGLLATLDEGLRVCAEIERKYACSEDRAWYPYLLVEY